MNEQDNRSETIQEYNIDLLIERVGTWYRQLIETKDNIEEIMSHPAAEIFLGSQESANTMTRYRGRPKEAGSRFPTTITECTTQEDIASYLAASNNGVANIREAVPIIKRLGLSSSTSDLSIRKNLGTVLVRSGRWAKVATWQYRSLNWKTPKEEEKSPGKGRYGPCREQEPEKETTDQEGQELVQETG